MPYDFDRGITGTVDSSIANEKISKLINTGQRVRLRHNNIIEYIMTQVAEVSDNDFKLTINEKVLQYNILNGHTISINYINDLNEECIVYGIVGRMTADFPQLLNIKPTKLEKYKDGRKTRRYATNLCCNILDEDKQYFGIIKNISFAGLRIFSKEVIEDRKNVTLQIFIDEANTIKLDVGMVRNKQFFNHNDYGFVVLESDQEERQKLREFVNKLEMVEGEQKLSL